MSNKRIGAKNFGDIYVEGKRYRSRREWRGVVDTLYDYSRWLYNWINMFRIVLVKPRNIKAMFPLSLDGELSGSSHDGRSPYPGPAR